MFNDFGTRLCNYVTEWLQSRGINASYEENDILIDSKYKVCGCAKTRRKDRVFSGMIFSINIDAELIRTICTKPTTKIPRGLSDYNITTEELRNTLLQFFSENNICD